MAQHLLEISDLSFEQAQEIVEIARRRPEETPKTLSKKGVALIFEKPSTRTRNSMEMAVVQLGGHPVYIQGSEINLGVRESIEDITRSLAQYHEVVCARVFDHTYLEEMAACDVVPVVNMLSNTSHPLQALADITTMVQEFGDVRGKKVAYIGDGNNVARSLALATRMFGMEFVCASPEGFALNDNEVDAVTTDPMVAVKDADVVYTDVWVSMGDEEQSDVRMKSFEGFTVTHDMMELASDNAIFMHCLPAHRGLEVSGTVIDSEQSRVWAQAQNRMHSARGVLAVLSS